jgi:hypothetical protein
VTSVRATWDARLQQIKRIAEAIQRIKDKQQPPSSTNNRKR